jgi:hypothetical protein
MMFRLLADATVALHLAFVLFVVAGGLLVIRWPRLAWAHIPSVVWGAWVEFSGWVCPLTPLENWLRQQAGQAVYTASFVTDTCSRSFIHRCCHERLSGCWARSYWE